MSCDARTIELWKYCSELAEGVGATLEIKGTAIRLIKFPEGDLINAFSDLDRLYNYLLGYQDGLAAVREEEMLDKMAFEDPDFDHE